MISKEISFHAPIKKSNYKSFRYVMPKIRITKQDEGVKVPEIKRNIWKALNPDSLKTGKTVYFKKTLSFSLSPIPLSIFQRWWKSSAYSKEQVGRNFTTRPGRSYLEDHAKVSSRICNCYKYHCINKYHP